MYSSMRALDIYSSMRCVPKLLAYDLQDTYSSSMRTHIAV